jgi:hypothetical protein
MWIDMGRGQFASLWQNGFMPPEALSAASLRRALVIKLRHHGDVLLAAPVISTLKRVAPQCEVDALVYADTAPMLEGHPALARASTATGSARACAARAAPNGA